MFLVLMQVSSVFFYIFGWKLLVESQESGRTWLLYVVVVISVLIMAVFVELVHPADPFEVGLIGALSALVSAIVFRRVNSRMSANSGS